MPADAFQEYQVQPDALRKPCSLPADFATRSADQRAESLIGQQRAIDAIRFGIEMRRDGYNIYVLGPIGSNRHDLVNSLVAEHAKTRGVPASVKRPTTGVTSIISRTPSGRGRCGSRPGRGASSARTCAT